jgi:uracil permease
VAAVIGIGLGYAALDMAQANWLVSVVTLVITILFSVYLRNRGFIGMLPVLLGAVVGYIVSVPFGLVDLSSVGAAKWFVFPHLTFPTFSGAMVMTAIFSIAIMCIATIPESTAHLYQISLYVDRFAEEVGQEKYELDQHIGFNLILDGIGDFINGLFGSTAGTNYGENNSLMAITRNYSGPVLVAAGVISMLLGFIGKLEALVGTVPMAVSGGLAIYLFGVIGMQGIALMVENKVNLFDARTLAVGATIMVIGIALPGHLPLWLARHRHRRCVRNPRKRHLPDIQGTRVDRHRRRIERPRADSSSGFPVGAITATAPTRETRN